MPREEARRRFKRIAAARANRVIENLRLLIHCADRKNYDYDQEQIDKIFAAIEEAVVHAKGKFVPRQINRIEL